MKDDLTHLEAQLNPITYQKTVVAKLYKTYPLDKFGFLFNNRGEVYYIFDYETRKLEYRGPLTLVVEWLRRNT